MWTLGRVAAGVNPVIRFRCGCGQKLVVAARLAGRKGRCPKCRAQMTVPKRSDPKAAPTPPKRAPRKGPRTDAEIFEAIVSGLGPAVKEHYASSEGYFVKMKLGDSRFQGVTLRPASEGQIEITSEIGMLYPPDRGLDALQEAERFPGLRLTCSSIQMLNASMTVPLPWTRPEPFVKAVEQLARAADAIELKLFGIDLR